MHLRCIAASIALLLVACNSASPSAGESDDGSQLADAGDTMSPDGRDVDGGSELDADGGVSGMTSDAGAASSGDGGELEDGGEPLPLPEGSRERDGVVNLVDPGAAAALEDFLASDEQVHISLREGLAPAVNLFLEHYLEEYDFVFFFTDHTLQGAATVGKFEAINRPAQPGGTSEIEVRAGGYASEGRLMAAIGVQYRAGILPPLGHETMHYWGNDLDARFGFGAGLDSHVGPHWGFSSVHGVLGGFDGESLRCETPAGALPPACTSSGGGRTRYVIGGFFPNDNTGRSVLYSPLEQYLMGLLPASEVPDAFMLLDDAVEIEGTYDAVHDTIVVEAADAVREVSFAEIRARHGEKALLAPDNRHFRAAFVLLSAQPAADSVLDDIVRYAEGFGARVEEPNWPSFETLTSGMATMDTTLGRRRSTTDPAAPAPRDVFTCDVLAQDCPRAELGCYEYFPALCALSGSVSLDQPCDATYACAPGLDCMQSSANPGSYVCAPYCDHQDDAAAKACQTLCASSTLELQDSSGTPISAICMPE